MSFQTNLRNIRQQQHFIRILFSNVPLLQTNLTGVTPTLQLISSAISPAVIFALLPSFYLSQLIPVHDMPYQ